MAEATLNDLNAQLKEINAHLTNPVQSPGDKEAAGEKARADAELKGIFEGILSTLQGGFGTAMKADKAQGGIIAGVLGGLGTGLGVLGEGVGKLGVGFAKGLAALGAGIAGFMLALGGTDVILGLMGATGESLKQLIQNFFGAFTEKTAAMMGGIILAAGLIVGLKVKKVDFMLAMGALGAGIAGFFLGIMAADGFATIGDALGLDGTKLATLMSNFFGAFDGIGIAVMGGVIAAAATIATLKIDKMALIGGMTAIGAGLAGFFLGIIAADGFASIGAGLGLNGESLKTLMGNFFGAFTQAGLTGVAVLGTILAAGAATAAAGIDPLKIVGGMTAVGAGLAGFFLGIIAADGFAKIADGLGVNGESLKTLMSNFFGAFTQAGITGIGVLMTIIAAGAGAAAAGIDPLKIVGGMSAVGAGLAGFFLGIIAADGFAKLAEGLSVDGSSLKTLMGNFFGAFSEAGVAGVTVLLTIIAAGAGAAAAGLSPLKIVGGMSAIGAGLAGFFLGILAAEGFAKIGTAAGLDGSNLKTLINNFVGAFQETSEAGLIAVGALLAVGATIGATLGAKGAVGVALGMTGIGAGLAGFFGGIMLADKFAETLGTDVPGAKLSTMMKNFMSAFSTADEAGLAALGVLLVAGAGFGIAGPTVALSVALGMTAMGAGLAGFFGGLMLADKFAETLGTDIPGAKLSTMMKNFFGAMSAADEKTLIAMGVLLAAGAAIGIALPGVGPAMVAVGMTALGAGVAGFFGGLLLADVAISKLGGEDAGAGIATLLTNLGKGLGGFVGGFASGTMEQLETLNADKLSKLGQGIKDLGVGILAFAGGQGVGAVTGVMSKIGSLFGSDSPLEQITDLSKKIKDEDADRLAKFGEGVGGLGTGLLSLSKADPESIEKTLASIANIKDLPPLTIALAAEAPEEIESTTKVASGGLITGMATGGLVMPDVPQLDTGGMITMDYTMPDIPQLETGGMITMDYTVPNFPQMESGGTPPSAGIFELHKGEMVLDNQAVAVFQKALSFVQQSQENLSAEKGGGNPVIINAPNVDNSNRVVSQTRVNVPMPVRTGESTKAALDLAYN